MPRNIITSPEQSFSSQLKKELANGKYAKFAVGWFFISGLKEIRDEIDKLDELLILISPTTNRQSAETLLAAHEFDEEVEDILQKDAFQTPEQKKALLQQEYEAWRKRTGKLPQTKENEEFLEWLAKNLAEKKIKLHIYTKELLHSKVYLVKDTTEQKKAFVGSSNISLPGFTLNTEVNVRLTDQAQCDKLDKWFDKKWDLSKEMDFTVLAEKAIAHSWALNEEVTPFRMYLRILHDIFSIDDDLERSSVEFEDGASRLFIFQKDAVIDAYHKLNKHNGVFIADVPGLGKTDIGAALLAHLQEEGQRGIVICPPKLIEQWEGTLDIYHANAKVISSGKISDIINNDRLMQRQVVLIDEAHHSRNPETISYKDLQVICEGKKVILVGATPQNLKLEDIYHQLKLFHPKEISDTLRIDPPELKKFFDKSQEERDELDAQEKFDVPDRSEFLFQQILIRRTRKNIIDEYGSDKLPDFPKRCGPYRIDYSIDEVYPGGMYNALDTKIEQLKFARYDIGHYVKPDEFDEEELQRLKAAGQNLRSIMRMILYRLLESSVFALHESLELMNKSHQLFLRGLAEGKVLAGESADKTYVKLKSDLDIEEIDIPDEAYETNRFHVERLTTDIQHDTKILEEMHDMVGNIAPEDDDKLQTLIRRITGDYSQQNWDAKGKEPCNGKKIIIFTQFATTAEYITTELKKHFSHVECVSGRTRNVLEKAALFSPKTESNKEYLRKREIEVTEKNRVDILVSTELLGEGMNLQDGQVIINYELHWNPVRIIQRIGRIDRIGSQNDFIWVYNFFPQLEAENRVGIERRVRKRIQEIQTRFGGDEKVITPDEQLVEKKFYQMYSEDKRALEEEAIQSLSGKLRFDWLSLKKQYPEEYAKALALPTQANCGMQSTNTGIAVYCRAGTYYKLLLGNKLGEVVNENDWEILSYLSCDPKEAKVKTFDTHHQVAEKIKKHFQERANSIENEKVQFLEVIKKQAIDRIRKASHGKDEKTKKWMSTVQGLVREVKLDVKLTRDLKGVIRKRHGLTPVEMVQEVERLLTGKPILEPLVPKKVYSEIVLSESLV